MFFFLLLFTLAPIGFAGPLGSLYLASSFALKACGVLVTAGGVAFAIWARHHLGSNRTGVPSLKVGHTLISSGPYAIVRHPIYTGILFGMFGLMLVLGTYGSLFVLILSSALVWVRIRQEERLMREEFGEAYQEYKKSVRTIIPWVL
jgi:protein-S-isoprenylcysteine O-methyltransferase Ste14